MRILPRSLAGQMALVLAAALLVAQTVNFAMLAQSRKNIVQIREEAAIARFVDLLERENIVERLGRRSGVRRPRWARNISISDAPIGTQFPKNIDLTASLVAALADAGITVQNAIATKAQRTVRKRDRQLERPPPPKLDPSSPNLDPPPRQALLLSVHLSTGQWVNAVQVSPSASPIKIGPLIIQTMLIYFSLLAAVFFVTRRLSRPLARLTKASQTILAEKTPIPLLPEGPEDVRLLTQSFSTMRNRIQHLFDEKDVMLGALGHDLRTPLTSLRIRVESVADEKLRIAMAETIEEMALQLDDILTLARHGHTGRKTQRTEFSVFIEGVLSSLPDTDNIIIAPIDAGLSADIHPTLLRRALRNLIENALRYGGNALVTIRQDKDRIAIIVCDDGPGIADEDLARVRQPFVRLDDSRNKATGGAGLGLALADRVAQIHQGALVLENKAAGGLCATICLQTNNSAP